MYVRHIVVTCKTTTIMLGLTKLQYIIDIYFVISLFRKEQCNDVDT